jgi:hypothetical protein
MALTLVEAAKLAMGRDEALKATVMELYARNSDILQYLPFENITGNALTFNREKTLPSVGFRGINESYDESTGQIDKVTESLMIAGGDLDVDVMLVKTGNADQRGAQEAMKIKALSMSMSKTIIKGDSETTPKEFDGMQIRCTGDQKVVAGSSASGDALSLIKLDELIDTVDEPTHLLMNKAMRRRLTAAARTTTIGGYITYDVDAFGRRITKYNDLPILIADKDNDYNDIMPFTEAATTGSSVCTSVYCMSFAENGVLGLQNGVMDVRDLGEIDTKPVYRTRIEWYISLAVLRHKAVARLWAIKDAAVTA